MYKKNDFRNKKKLNKVLLCLLKTLITSDPDRHHPRVRIKPIGKWYFCRIYNKIT